MLRKEYEGEQKMNFDFMSRYVFREGDPRAEDSRHAFFSLSLEEIMEVEERLGYKFPAELREFYFRIGYGFLMNDDKSFSHRILNPQSVANRILDSKSNSLDQSQGNFSEGEIPFLAVNELSYMTICCNEKNELGISPIYHEGRQIAPSLQEFLKRVDEKGNQYR
jgi:hypothetical protein